MVSLDGAACVSATIGALAPSDISTPIVACLLYTSDAADDLLCVDLGGRRFIKKKKTLQKKNKHTAHGSPLTRQEIDEQRQQTIALSPVD